MHHETQKAIANGRSALVDMDKDDGWKDAGASEPEGTLAFVPVKVETKKGNNIITTYDSTTWYYYLDPGNTATFCSESVLQQLQVTGRKAEILLRSMNKQFTKTSVACDFEISGLDSNEYVETTPEKRIFFHRRL